MSDTEKMKIPEAAVEAAARLLYKGQPTYDEERGVITGYRTWESAEPGHHDILREEALLILEAAAPHIMAEALEDAAEAFDALPVNKGATISTGTSDWFELFPVQHIRDRAEDIRSTK